MGAAKENRMEVVELLGGMQEAEATVKHRHLIIRIMGKQTSVRGCSSWWMLYSVDAVLGICCTRSKLYLVCVVLGVCCTQCLLYSVYAILGVYFTQCQLLHMEWGGCKCWPEFILYNNGDIVDEKERWVIKMGTIWRISAHMRQHGCNLSNCALKFLN